MEIIKELARLCFGMGVGLVAFAWLCAMPLARIGALNALANAHVPLTADDLHERTHIGRARLYKALCQLEALGLVTGEWRHLATVTFEGQQVGLAPRYYYRVVGKTYTPPPRGR